MSGPILKSSRKISLENNIGHNYFNLTRTGRDGFHLGVASFHVICSSVVSAVGKRHTELLCLSSLIIVVSRYGCESVNWI